MRRKRAQHPLTQVHRRRRVKQRLEEPRVRAKRGEQPRWRRRRVVHVHEREVVGLVDFDKLVCAGGAEDVAYGFAGGACRAGGGGVQWDDRGVGSVAAGAIVEDEGGAGAKQEVGLAVDGGDEGFVGREEKGLE